METRTPSKHLVWVKCTFGINLFITAFFRYNLHTTQFNHLMCTILSVALSVFTDLCKYLHDRSLAFKLKTSFSISYKVVHWQQILSAFAYFLILFIFLLYFVVCLFCLFEEVLEFTWNLLSFLDE